LTVFERFTDRARRVVVLAQEEARLLNHNYIGTEHILLGLIHEGEGVAARALEALEISLEDVRAAVEEIIGHGGEAPTGHIPFTPRAKKVLELSLREGMQLGHNYIGTEHILLGLIREGEGVAAQVLVRLGGDLTRVRQQVIELLSGHAERAATLRGASATGALGVSPQAVHGPVGSRPAPHCSFCGRDLWEVDHYAAGATAFMCDVCIVSARDALDVAARDTQLLAMPPRVFGDPPADDPHVLEKIVEALSAVFGPELGEDAAASLEDGERLVPILRAARERLQGIVTEVVVQRVRFATPAAASVGFELIIDSRGRFSFVGDVMRIGDRWVVTRTMVADVLRTGGISLPPAV
jgi:hypothetical protein